MSKIIGHLVSTSVSRPLAMRYVRVCILLFHNRLSFCYEIAMSEVIDGTSQHSSRGRAMCLSPSDRQRDR